MKFEANKLINEIWTRFINKRAAHVFGEKAVISEGKKLKNLLGSVKSHKETFQEAAMETFEDLLQEDQ